MRIGIDARFFGSIGKGLGRYTQKLIENLEKISAQGGPASDWIIPTSFLCFSEKKIGMNISPKANISRKFWRMSLGTRCGNRFKCQKYSRAADLILSIFPISMFPFHTKENSLSRFMTSSFFDIPPARRRLCRLRHIFSRKKHIAA